MKQKFHYTGVKERDLYEVAHSISESLLINRIFPVVVFLKGDLGAGKTTLIKHLARELGYLGNITSPTYNICKMYQGEIHRINHIDLYRLDKSDDLYQLGLYDYISIGISFVEWPDLAVDVKKYILIEIKITDENTREITVTGD